LRKKFCEFPPQRYINKNRVRFRYLDNEVSCQQHFVKIFTPPIIETNTPVWLNFYHNRNTVCWCKKVTLLFKMNGKYFTISLEKRGYLIQRHTCTSLSITLKVILFDEDNKIKGCSYKFKNFLTILKIKIVIVDTCYFGQILLWSTVKLGYNKHAWDWLILFLITMKIYVLKWPFGIRNFNLNHSL